MFQVQNDTIVHKNYYMFTIAAILITAVLGTGFYLLQCQIRHKLKHITHKIWRKYAREP